MILLSVLLLDQQVIRSLLKSSDINPLILILSLILSSNKKLAMSVRHLILGISQEHFWGIIRQKSVMCLVGIQIHIWQQR